MLGSSSNCSRRSARRSGIDAVAVEPLARRLGVTKGSFYWHFKDRRALLEATLEGWEREPTDAVIAASRRVEDTRERLIRLGEEAFGEIPRDGDESGKVLLERGVELAISDAAADDVVRPFFERVTEHRIGYLEECFARSGFRRRRRGTGRSWSTRPMPAPSSSSGMPPT